MLFAFVAFANITVAQSSDFNTTYLILNVNGSQTYYDLKAATANTDFQGANLGTFTIGTSTLVYNGAEHNIYKCGGCDFTSSRLYYRIYKTSGTPGSFVSNNVPYSGGAGNGCGGEDQQWKTTAGTTNLLASLAPGAYTMEVYSDASITCSGGTAYANNSGANYKATFTVAAPAGLPVVVTSTGGTALASYATLKAAFDAINAGIHTGTIAIAVDGNTTEAASAVLNASGSGSANYTSVNIAPSKDAITVSGSVNSNSLVRLNGADNVIIDGDNSNTTGINRNLTITNTSTTVPTAISLVSSGTGAGASNNVIRNLNVSTGVVTATGSFGIAVGGITPGSAGADNDNVTIQNNSITVATVPVYANGNATVSAGGMDNLLVTGNTISTTSALVNTGIRVGNGLSSTISLNNISVETSATNAPVGISIEPGFVSSLVTQNIISKVLATNTGGYGGRGITINTNSSNSSLVISNNFIFGVNGSNETTFGNSSSMGIGIGVAGSTSALTSTAGGVSLYYNSVNMAGSYTRAANAITTALYVGTGASALNIRNNIFVNSLNNTSGSGTGAKAYSIYSAAANTVFTTINYNDYYVSGSQGVLGYIGSDRANLAAIQTGFGSNTNSVNTDPQFISAVNLHLSPASTLESLGTPIAGITTDIDGETRNTTTPDIGADEYTGTPPSAPSCATLNLPANAATGLCQPVTFTWTAPATGTAPTGYKFYLGTDGGGTVTPTNQVNGTIITGLTNSVSGLLPSTTYYWQVIATSPFGDAAGCTIRSFTTSSSVFETTTPVTDNFESCPEWTIVNHGTNQWFTGTAAGNPGSSMYISNSSGSTNAYTLAGSQTSHFYRDITFPAGETIYNFTFDLRSAGETDYDRLLVYVVPTSTTPVAGTPASQNTSLSGAAPIFIQANSTTYANWTTVDLSAALNSTIIGNSVTASTRRIIFTWQNDISAGTQTPAAVDNINITSAVPAPLAIGTITATQVTGNTYVNAGNQNILRIDIPTSGSLGTQTLNSVTVRSANITDADIAANGVTLWTGTSAGPVTQIGGPPGQTFAAGAVTFSGLTTAITTGTNYLWVRYNISATATAGNTVDAKINAGDIVFTAAGGATAAGSQPVSNLDPAGNRPIVGALCGTTYTINNTLPTSGLNYNNFTDAINDLNVRGISCAVVFNVKDGQVFNELPPAITTTGTAANTITFQRDNSTGTRPVLTGTTGVGSADAILQLNGVDYLVWNGINLADNTANSTDVTKMEYAVHLKGAATDGCKNNVFRNFSAGFNGSNTNIRKVIYSLSAATTAGGTNSNNKFYNLAVSNSAWGYSFENSVASGQLYDDGNEINTEAGGTSSISSLNPASSSAYGVSISYQTNFSVKNTAITTFLGVSANLYGVYAVAGSANTFTIENNTISGFTSTGTGALVAGMRVTSSGAATCTITGNSIFNFSCTGVEVAGISVDGGIATITNNNIGVGGAISMSTNTSLAYGIKYGAATAGTITGNVISNINVTGTSSSGYFGIHSAGPGSVISNNTVQNFTSLGASATQYGISSTGGNTTISSNVLNSLACSNGAPVVAVRVLAAGTTVLQNTITGISSTQGNTTGIYNDATATNTQINSNIIRNLSSGNVSSLVAAGIEANGTGTVYVQKNIIDNIVNLGGTSARAMGIRANGGTKYLINNMISKINADNSNSGSGPGVRGISLEGTTAAKVYFNTVYLAGTGTNSSLESNALYTSTSIALDSRNNILFNNYQGSGIRSAVYITTTLTTYNTNLDANSNNNLLFAGATPGTANAILKHSGGVSASITDYKTAVGGVKEFNSFTATSIPFVNVATLPTNLHIDVTQNGLCSIDARGVAITTPITVTDDIDADARQTPPDVGADEFTLPDPLAGSIAASANPVCLPAAITLTGSGQSTGSDFYYQWQVNTGSGYTDLANAGVYSGVTTAVLTISDATGLNGYKYQLLVKRCSPASKTVATNEITLTVSTASNVASAILNASPAASCAGTNVTLTQSGGTLGTGAKWQWYTDAAFTTTVGGQLTSPDASLTVAPTVTTTYYLRAINGTAPCAATVAVTGSVTVTVTPGGQWIGPATGGDWNVAANWCGGVPTAITNVVIPSWAVVDIKSADAVASSVTIQGPTGGINMMGTYNLGITSGGSITNSGVLNATASTGAVIFNGAGTVNGTITFKNVIINGGVDFGAASTIGAAGSLNIVGGGFVNNNAPTYDCGSTLIYNTSNTYGRNLEWGTATSGKGYPGNVRVTGNTTLNYPNGSTAGRSMCGNLTIDAGSALYMDYGGTNPTAPLTVGGNVTLNGNMSFSNAAGGDLNIAGNWTRGAAGNLYPNNRAVIFNGTAMQTITRTGGGTEDAFAYMVVNKTSNNVVLNNSPATAVNLTANTGDVLQLLNGNLDLNGQAFHMNNNGGNIKVSGGARTITGTTGSTLFINGNKTIVSAAGGTLVTDVNVKIENNAALDFGANLTTVNGTLQLNSGSFVNANAPFYGNASLLVYNAGGAFPYNRRVEWSGTVPGGVGYPNDVLVTNNTTLQPGGNTSPTDFRNIAFNARRDVTINAGSAIYMDATGMAMNVPLKVGGNLTISGSLSASTVAGGDVYVSGNWVRTGTFTPNDRAVFFDGNTNATITATGGQTFDYAYLTKTGATLQLLDDVTIIKELGPQSGTLDLAAKNITIHSTAANTASVSAVGAAITYGTGRFIIERYISFPRKWHSLSVPAKTTQSIFEAWQDGGSSATSPTGYGVQITGPGPIAGTGLDAVTNAPSMKYQAGVTTSFTGITQTNTAGSLANIRGYYLYVYGNRSSVAPAYSPSPTTLRTTGRLFIGTTGNADMPVAVNQPAVLGDNISVGNPLPSAIDFTALKAASSNIAFNYKVWDPSQSGTYGSGIYQTIEYSTGGIATPGGGSIYNTPIDHRFIQSGQAIYVQAAGTGNVVVPFTESMKVSGSRLVNRGNDPHDQIDPASVSMISAMLHGSDGRLYDGNRVVLDNVYSTQVDDNDANKMMNDGINFGNTRFGKTMAVEARSRLSGGDTIQYYMANTFAGQYQLRLAMQNVNEPLLQAELVDRFTNTRTPVSLTDSSFINISITADAASRASNRFYLVFKQTTLVPVTFVGISAARQADRSIAVKWQVQNEVNISRYEVERSADGVHFNGILQADALNSGTYTKTDIAPLAADNFYRIKAIGIAGEVIYSGVVKVAPDKQPALIAVTPNPVKDKQLAIRFVKQPAGAYALQLTNGLGQTIYKGIVTVNAGAEVKTIPLHPKTATGSYQLSIRNKEGVVVYSETILIE